MNRRQFIWNMAAVGTAVTVAQMPKVLRGAEPAPATGEVPRRKLGRTDEMVSIVGLGGSHLGFIPTDEESTRLIRAAIDNGINFMDNSWDYHKGLSEIRMGKALKDGYRQKVFLMTKIDGRTGKAAIKQVDESLQRLQTDHLDLLQFHEIIRMTDPEMIFAPGGAYEAVMAAKQAGKVRYVGFTGHKSPEIHLKMLQTCFAHDFTPVTVQMPLNVMDAHFDSFQKMVLPVLLEHHIAPLAMKPMGSPFILKSKTVTPLECLHYDMNLPVAVVITGCDSMAILDQALNAARTFKPMSPEQVTAILAKTKEAAQNGEYEKYKTSEHFDSTAKHPEWLTS